MLARRGASRRAGRRGPPDVPDVEETGDHARGQRPPQGGRALRRPPACPPSPTTPASRSTRSAARPACTRLATPARTPPTPTTCDEAARASSTTCRSSAARRASPPWPSPAGPTAARWPRSATVEGVDHRARPWRRRDSGTTRCSCPIEGDGRTFAEMTAGEKHALSHRGRAFRTLADGLRACRSHGNRKGR